MAIIELRYGRGSVPFQFDGDDLTLIGNKAAGPPLSDAAVGELLDRPIDSPPLEDLISPGESVLVVVPDATRRTAAGQVVNLLVRRLIANGTAPHDLHIIFATGIHRSVTSDEKATILTPFIMQRITTYDHDPRDLMQIVKVGETSGGIPVQLNRRLLEHDHVVTVGGVTFHYFAGYTGGRKLICPGLASSRTVAETHKLAFDCQIKARRQGVDTGLLDGNPVHEAFVEAAALAPPTFAVNTIVDDAGEAVRLYCGDWLASHRAACAAYAEGYTVFIQEQRDLVVVSCGGYPLDINIIQAHKALDAAARACKPGGTIVLLAECADGLGRSDFLKWFEAGSSSRIAERLCERYQVNGQTAWSLKQKTERYRVLCLSSLPSDVLAVMGMEKLSEFGRHDFARHGYVIADGAKVNVRMS
jgi:nickel-dependent lactate racemase